MICSNSSIHFIATAITVTYIAVLQYTLTPHQHLKHTLVWGWYLVPVGQTPADCCPWTGLVSAFANFFSVPRCSITTSLSFTFSQSQKCRILIWWERSEDDCGPYFIPLRLVAVSERHTRSTSVLDLITIFCLVSTVLCSTYRTVHRHHQAQLHSRCKTYRSKCASRMLHRSVCPVVDPTTFCFSSRHDFLVLRLL